MSQHGSSFTLLPALSVVAFPTHHSSHLKGSKRKFCFLPASSSFSEMIKKSSTGREYDFLSLLQSFFIQIYPVLCVVELASMAKAEHIREYLIKGKKPFPGPHKTAQ